MKKLTQLFSFKKVLIKLGVTFLVLISTLALVNWFYSSTFMLENRIARNVRSRMDEVLYNAYLQNTFGYRDYLTYRDPTLFAWRPTRIIPDMLLPSDWEGNTSFNTIFGEVYEWSPEEGILGVLPYVDVDSQVFYVDVNSAKLIVPHFDEVSQPLPENEVDDTFATEEEWDDFMTSFNSASEMYDFMDLFENQEELTSFVATNFGSFDERIQFGIYDGPVDWESSFCEEDIVTLSFTKEVDILGYEDVYGFEPKASVVVVSLSSCPSEYFAGTEEITQ